MLLVEDNLVNQRIFQRVIGSLGYACHIASSGTQAISMVSSLYTRFLEEKASVDTTDLSVQDTACTLLSLLRSLMDDQRITSVCDYDVVLMDLHLLDMTGFDATSTIQHKLDKLRKMVVKLCQDANVRVSDGICSKMPAIIALTGAVDLETKERCVSQSMNGYLTKPVSGKDLNQAIDFVMHHHDSFYEHSS